MENIITAGLSAALGKKVVIGGDELPDGQELSLENMHMCTFTWRTHVIDDEIDKNQKAMDIFVQTMTGKILTIIADPLFTINQLKEKIQEKEGTTQAQQMLTYGGNQLQDHCTLSHHNIQAESKIILMENTCPYFKIDEKVFDPQYNYEYPATGNKGEDYRRGNKKFERPYGCEKYAIKIIGKYDSDEWLGVSGNVNREYDVPGEWPVSYHGTKTMHAESITKNGYELSKGIYFKFGVGIYSAPSPDVAARERYAETFYYKNKRYKLIFMNRVNPDYTREVLEPSIGIYYVTSDQTQIRPYAILIKKVDS